MPELPDIVVYIEALEPRVVGRTLEAVRIRSISLLRTYDPPIQAAEGRTVEGLRRLGKRIVFDLGDDLFLVLHLMVAGRLRWSEPGAAIPGKIGLAAFDFTEGTLLLREAGTKKRASLHCVAGEDALARLDRGGIDVAAATPEAFAAGLTRERHTLKRTLTDPRIYSGIGGAYADEILHRARLSPMLMSDRLDPEQAAALHAAAVDVLDEWTDRLRKKAGGDFPTEVTAFHPEMAVHGKYGEPCPVCGSPVQRIVYSSNETNYCPGCQTGGRILADRSLSRLLKDDFPKSLEDLEG
jgi:formamidopyrimidine-DNA glycosylase